MKAAVVERYGPADTVHIAEVEDPRPGRGQVVVRVEATPVTAGDARIRGARYPQGLALPARLAFGVFRPRRRILGGVLAGVVVEAGAGVEGLRPGQRVAGMTGAALGAHAELAAVDASRLVPIPEGLAPAAAAAVLFGGATALHYLRDRAHVQPGQTVLVNGASGAVGSSSVQVARHLGARVTAVTSGANAALAARLGADAVVDYTATALEELPQRFDAVLDAVGSIPRALGLRLLKADGVLLQPAASLWDMLRATGRVKAGPSPERPEDFAVLLSLAAEGVLDPVLNELGGLDAVPAAHALVDSGRKVGNAVVRPA